MKKNEGYTLIELLVVSGILVAVSGIIGGILISTLRSSDTTRTKTHIAQNGNYALSAMSELVKRSKNVTGVGEIQNFVDCVNETPPQGESLTLLMPEEKEVVLFCENDTKRIASSSGETTYYLTGDDLSIVEGSCSFKCHQTSRFTPPRVEIMFQLGKEDGVTGEVDENTVELFQTQISSRNFINN